MSSEPARRALLAAGHGVTQVHDLTSKRSLHTHVLLGELTLRFIYMKSVTHSEFSFPCKTYPKPLMEGCEAGSHIKGINQRHNFGFTRVIFHLHHVAKHLALDTLVLLLFLLRLLQLARSTMSLTALLPQRCSSFSLLLHPSV